MPRFNRPHTYQLYLRALQLSRAHIRISPLHVCGIPDTSSLLVTVQITPFEEMSAPASPSRGHKRSMSAAYKRDSTPPPVRSREPLPPQSEVAPKPFGMSHRTGTSNHQKNLERAERHLGARFEAALTSNITTSDSHDDDNSPSSLAFAPVRPPTSPQAVPERAYSTTIKDSSTGPMGVDLEADLEEERSSRRVLENQLRNLNDEMMTLTLGNHSLRKQASALRQENQTLSKEKEAALEHNEALRQSYEKSASVLNAHNEQVMHDVEPVNTTQPESEIAPMSDAPRDLARSNSPKSRRIRRLEDMVEINEIEIASLRDHNQRMDKLNTEQLQEIRELEASLRKEKEESAKAEEQLNKAKQEYFELLQDVEQRPMRSTRRSRF